MILNNYKKSDLYYELIQKGIEMREKDIVEMTFLSNESLGLSIPDPEKGEVIVVNDIRYVVNEIYKFTAKDGYDYIRLKLLKINMIPQNFQDKLKNTIDHIKNIIDLEKYYDIIKYHVKYNPNITFENDTLFSCCVVFNDASGEITSEIYVDDFFFLLDDDTKLDVLYHEVGHIVTVPELKRLGKTENIYYEIEADLYAAKIRGPKEYLNRYKKFKKLVNDIYLSVMGKNEPSDDTDELIINALTELVESINTETEKIWFIQI